MEFALNLLSLERAGRNMHCCRSQTVFQYGCSVREQEFKKAGNPIMDCLLFIGKNFCRTAIAPEAAILPLLKCCV
jgi:hypothetical protein